jgi:hypothetical protein
MDWKSWSEPYKGSSAAGEGWFARVWFVESPNDAGIWFWSLTLAPDDEEVKEDIFISGEAPSATQARHTVEAIIPKDKQWT